MSYFGSSQHFITFPDLRADEFVIFNRKCTSKL